MKRGLCLVLIGLIVQCCWADDSPGELCEPEKKFDCGYFGINAEQCVKERGCCWAESDDADDPWCFLTTTAITGKCQPDQEKKDCGYFGIDQKECEERQCCWEESDTAGEPWCYQKTAPPTGKYGYRQWIRRHRYRAGQEMREMANQLKWERGHNRMNPEVYRRYWDVARKDTKEYSGMKWGPPGMKWGPPGMKRGPTGSPGMKWGPPGMKSGPPGMKRGPPGMKRGPAGSPGMKRRPPPTG